MGIMFFLFPSAALISLILWILNARFSGRWAGSSPELRMVLVGLAASYGLAWLLLCIDPYFDDNGAPEFIEWRFRWAWAQEFAGWLAVFVVPAVFGVQYILGRLRGAARRAD